MLATNQIASVMNLNDNSQFPITRISLIDRVQDVDGEIRRKALEEFIAGYRPALISFLVKCKRIDATAAEDIVHDFLLNKVMDGKVLELAGNKGRFRNLLRTCLQNHLVDSLRSKKRERVQDQIDPAELDELDPNQTDAIDQVWAIAIFREALMTMKTESEYWGVFFDRVLTMPPLPYDQVIIKHGFENPETASNALMTAKRQFNRTMEQLVARQTYLTGESTTGEIESEIEFLREQLRDSDLFRQVIDALAEQRGGSQTGGPNSSNTIFGDRLLFIDEGADGNWNKSDACGLLQHLFNQPVHRFVDSETCPNLTIGQILFESSGSKPETLPKLASLKASFNDAAKKKRSPLPERINVTMTFSSIASFVVHGGEVEQITSMRRDVLIQRLEQLVEKTWLPEQITKLCTSAISVLLQ